ncbi:ferrichrome ABC transporter ATP-binding protein [Myxococcus stipitatus DSM 14675]|uniref:Ferrichrome ABC transporter ATP-binding protein n=1 Tax=Myxococcus stipitatus (strain DSM 14675 / JCM 12634 / Mx s8) TaxID=1278073 RepID=L7U756_MYXSD|nr:ABC transporter ATP-binding protein [Myxococcus stipitatus]AGC42324.1 ferrichrome ABC transporter ATP-binding protein [Myxococcus stipitatus DSM 14675]
MTSSLEVSGATVRKGERLLLEDVSLRVAPGDFVAIVGPNGAGKSTLMRAALGLQRLEAGRVTLGGREVSALSPRERAAFLAWLPQRVQVSEPITALEHVAAARYRFTESRQRSEQAALTALARVQADALATRPITELSGGEQQRVAVAALLAQEAPLVMLDEPANFLDPAQQLELYALVGRLWRSGLGVLCITHDINVLAHAMREGSEGRIRVVGLSSGRVAFESSYDAPELGEHLGRVFSVRMRGVEVEGRRVFVSLPREHGS